MNLSKLKKIDNQQLYNFTREQTQVFLTANLGDGYIGKTNSNSWIYVTSCKHKEYLEHKRALIGKGNIKLLNKNGCSQTPIYTMYGGVYADLEKIKSLSLVTILKHLDKLGIALWFYDDGSLHKRDLFYNLNTQKFTLKEHENILIPYFNSIGLYPHIHKDTSKNLYYLNFGKWNGAYDISCILRNYYVECYSYKLWSSETILKWSKLQEQLKSTDIEYSNKNLSYLLKSI